MGERTMNRKKKKKILLIIIILLYIPLAINTFATERLNKKYTGKVARDPETHSYCEQNGDEYLVSAKCKFLQPSIGAGVEISNIYYDEKHPDVKVSLDITETKWGNITYLFSIDASYHDYVGYMADNSDPDFGGYVYIDENFNPIATETQSIDLNMVTYMNNLHEEIERLIEIANDKWDLGLSYEY
jgi:hypothetical protein